MSDEELIKKYIKEEDQNKALEKLKNGYPIQYIIGNVEFYNSIINVNENVLIPRFETEYLVDKVLKFIDKYDINKPNILDLGTGSGCIAISLKKNIESTVTALDISKEALKVAKENAKINDVDIMFVEDDIFDYKPTSLFDIIIANPPYVTNDSPIDEKILYEPASAIFAPGNGVIFYEAILKNIKDNLKEKYLIAFEIGDKQGKLIEKLANKYLPRAKVIIENDYNGYERYVFITNYDMD